MAGEPILVVDDNEVNLELLSFLLLEHGYQVHQAADAVQALELLRTVKPRLILLDLQLPGIDGFELTRRLKADPETRDILIVAVTAYAMKGDEQRARAAGCDDYISKPIDTRGLPDRVKSWCQQNR